MNKNTTLRILVFMALLSAQAIGPAAASDTHAADTSVQGNTIAWVDGNVDQAFATAKAQNKPLFLYWGAVWCPPCVQIKNTVFKSRDFIALSELFVPYYLDGDTNEAQATGERFGVKGYPTMIVFSPAGEEITRIPGGIDIDRYNSVLRRSLDQLRPTSELLKLAMKASDSLNAEDYTQLAYYSWGQDYSVLPEDAEPSLFLKLADQAAAYDKIAAARLYMQYLVSSVQENSEESPVKIQHAGSRIEQILASDELVIDCWDSLAYWPEIVDILVLEDDAKKRLSKIWQDRLMALRNSPRLSTEEQLAGWLPLLHYHFEATEEPLPAPVATQLDQDIAHADQKVTNAYARQSLVNQIRWIYQTAHMNDKARAVLLAELDRSKAPYYFMSSLGSLAEDQEQTEEAIEWYRKAYETSEGSATRFQWGASYVRALIRLAPDQDELILSTAESLFDELPSSDDVFSGRNFRVLKRLNEQLVVWKADEDSEAVNTRFTARIESLCAAEVDGSIEKANCQSLIAEDSAS